MNKALLAVVIVLALCLAAAIYFCITLNQDKNALADELESTQGVVASTELKLAATETELTDTNDTLNATLTELDDAKDTLTSTLTELSDTR
jgi:septal ring factor EnvC (AmiA/AmiB activator)